MGLEKVTGDQTVEGEGGVTLKALSDVRINTVLCVPPSVGAFHTLFKPWKHSHQVDMIKITNHNKHPSGISVLLLLYSC